MAAEMVREKVLTHTRAELPFSTAVAIDEFDETDRDDLLRIYCTIFVEQESQKPIVIGRGGEMVKRIGTEARQDLERFFGTKVFLDLRVKVNPDWRNNERTLDELGVPKRTAKPKRQR
jgi:GTP-binding protein Era